MNPSKSALRQLAVFARCMRIFDARNKRYNDLWASRGFAGSLFQMDHKMARIWQQFWTDKKVPSKDREMIDSDMDDVYDLINYSGFFVRNVQDGNERGVMR